MSPRTLSDELRSVLMFHALEAPEPNTTVDRILSDTVGAVTALDSPDAEYRRPAPDGRRLRVRHLVAAAVVAVLLVAVAGINSVRSRDIATDTAAGRDQSSVHGPVNGGAAVAGPMAVPPVANGAQAKAGPVEPPVYTGHELDCASIPGGRLVTGQWDDFTLPGGQVGYLYEFLCVGPEGQRSASEVQVFRQAGATLRYQSTLLYPAAGLEVSFLVGGLGTARIQTYVTSLWNGYPAGDVITTNWDLTAADPRAGASSGIALDAGGIVAGQASDGDCSVGNLAVTVSAVASAAVPSWRLMLRNDAGRACGLAGFPVVAMQRGGLTVSTARPTLNGPGGGVRNAAVPPIIVLPPGATAAAVLEQNAPAAGPCPQSDQLAVTLPNGVALEPVPAQLPTCALVVHPLVGNARGVQ